MTPEDHAKELLRLKGRVTRARTRMKTHAGTLATKLAMKAAVAQAETAVREHKLAFYALTQGSRPAPALTEAEARAVAHWVCTHDTGVRPAGEAVQIANGWAVRFSGHEITATGAVNIVRNDAFTYADARAILGY